MSWGPKITDLPNDATYGGNVANAYTKADGLHQGQYYNPKYAAAGLSGWTTPQTYDNVGDFFKTGFTQNATFNISQRRDNVSYSFSLSDTYQNGIVPSTGMTRTGARGAVDWQINKEWKTGFSANYSSVKITSAPGANEGITNIVYSKKIVNFPFWNNKSMPLYQRINIKKGIEFTILSPLIAWNITRYNLTKNCCHLN